MWPHPAVLAGARLLLVQAEPVPGGAVFFTSGSLVLGAGWVVGFSTLTHAHTILLTINNHADSLLSVAVHIGMTTGIHLLLFAMRICTIIATCTLS